MESLIEIVNRLYPVVGNAIILYNKVPYMNFCIKMILNPGTYDYRLSSRESSISSISYEIAKLDFDRSINHKFEIKEVCGIALAKKDVPYYRVKIVEFVNKKSEQCKFLDVCSADVEVSLKKLIKLSKDLRKHPAEIQTLSLSCIQPCSLQLTGDVGVRYGPSDLYDISAVYYVEDLLNNNKIWKVIFTGLGGDQYNLDDINPSLLFYADAPTTPPNAVNNISNSSNINDNCSSSHVVWTCLNRDFVQKNYAFLKSDIPSKCRKYFGLEDLTSINCTSTVKPFRSSNPLSSIYRNDDTISITEPPLKVDATLNASIFSGRGRGAILKDLLERRRLMKSANLRISNDESGAKHQNSLQPNENVNIVNDIEATHGNNLQNNDLVAINATDKLNDEDEAVATTTNTRYMSADENLSASSKHASSTPAIANGFDTTANKINKVIKKVDETTSTKTIVIKTPLNEVTIHECSPATTLFNNDSAGDGNNDNVSFGRGRGLFKLKSNLSRRMYNIKYDDEVWAATDDIWIDSPIKTFAEVDLKNSKYYNIIKMDKNLKSMTQPTALQSCMWSAILKLFDVFGVGPQVPRHLPDCIDQVDVISGKTPIVIIICPSSDVVAKVSNQLHSLLANQKHLPNYSRNINFYYLTRSGGDILVTTPVTLLRVFDLGLVSFQNACHLVLEEADVLTNLFAKQMDRIIDSYNLVLNSRRCRSSLPHQILTYAQHWTPQVEQFVFRYMKLPVVAIASKMEAVYAGQVEMYLDKFFKRERLAIGICTTTSSDCEIAEVFNQWKAINIPKSSVEDEAFLNGESDGNNDDVGSCKSDFKIEDNEDFSSFVLVLSDDVMKMMLDVRLSDATMVIHFDYPDQQSIFADRLWCTREHFQKISDRFKYQKMKALENPEEQKMEIPSLRRPKSILMVSKEECESGFIKNLYKVLKRSGCTNIPSFMHLSVKLLESEQGRINKMPLCDYFKSFGECFNQSYCKQRHVINKSADIDKDREYHIDIPTSVVVKMLITNIKNPFIYHAHILEWVDPVKQQPIKHSQAKILALQLAEYFGCHSNCVKVDPNNVKLNVLLAYMDADEVFLRVQVIRVSPNSEDYLPTEAVVSCVDYGRLLHVKVDKLLVLPDQFQRAVEICLCRLKPVDQDTTWNSRKKNEILFVSQN
ncbi:hypothetical protein HELRODRAFT_159552 [Helobdella robusta]|uniref:RNA helicase n=1 Tax=Helobdella robusta TaxID=6412 RepID=T1EP55_HELRO|nr:hypothetical protein HELRODRAFT_159552 [Helobdella robusta]ESO12958.1 hypothetical protein HELRODRAFT_159552 [Helobdella robusta]